MTAKLNSFHGQFPSILQSKVVTSRSSSSHELDEALKEAEAQREAANSGGLTVSGSSSTATPTTTPTQLEKPVA